MNNSKIFFGHTNQDGILLLDVDGVINHLKTIRGDVQVIAGKRKRQRTLSMNALYWVWLEVIERETGNNKNDIHAYMKTKFLKRTKQVFGAVHEVVLSSALLDTLDFSRYMASVKQFALDELNIILPDTEL